eukprot:TRINITY_DN1077_c0_g1_i1.p1 TRINITY_DN1077_c0_g1~~TRINITY_DN1077_c0_g1_i1.p1  ORF type:complete len:317 (-),score=52.05 TRINITY_DN1077_c0_g1_i1:309-1259(-)
MEEEHKGRSKRVWAELTQDTNPTPSSLMVVQSDGSVATQRTWVPERMGPYGDPHPPQSSRIVSASASAGGGRRSRDSEPSPPGQEVRSAPSIMSRASLAEVLPYPLYQRRVGVRLYGMQAVAAVPPSSFSSSSPPPPSHHHHHHHHHHHPGSTQPQHNWLNHHPLVQCSVQKLFFHQRAAAEIRQFLIHIECVEVMDFWFAMDHFRDAVDAGDAPFEEMIRDASRIYCQYVRPPSYHSIETPEEARRALAVELRSLTQEVIQKRGEEPSESVFARMRELWDTLQKEVSIIIKERCLPHFWITPEGARLLRALPKGI